MVGIYYGDFEDIFWQEGVGIKAYTQDTIFSQVCPNLDITAFTGYNGFFENLPVFDKFDDAFWGLGCAAKNQVPVRVPF